VLPERTYANDFNVALHEDEDKLQIVSE
jgi:hypothetical protein